MTEKTAMVEFRGALQAMESQFAAALPPHISPEKFIRTTLTAVQLNPDLLTLDRRSLFAATMRCAQDGLLPDNREAAFVKFGSVCQYLPMVGGILKKVRNSGDLASITANVVYERDQFTYELGDDEKIRHVPYLSGDRGALVAVYAIAKTKDGAVYREVMAKGDVMAVRAISRSKTGPWDGPFESEMWRKTAIRRLAKRLPMSTDLERVINRDDELYDLNLAVRQAAPVAAQQEQPEPGQDKGKRRARRLRGQILENGAGATQGAGEGGSPTQGGSDAPAAPAQPTGADDDLLEDLP